MFYLILHLVHIDNITTKIWYFTHMDINIFYQDSVLNDNCSQSVALWETRKLGLLFMGPAKSILLWREFLPWLVSIWLKIQESHLALIFTQVSSANRGNTGPVGTLLWSPWVAIKHGTSTKPYDKALFDGHMHRCNPPGQRNLSTNSMKVCAKSSFHYTQKQSEHGILTQQSKN